MLGALLPATLESFFIKSEKCTLNMGKLSAAFIISHSTYNLGLGTEHTPVSQMSLCNLFH